MRSSIPSMVAIPAAMRALPRSGEHDQLAPAVRGVRGAFEVAQLFELVDKLAHGLRAHVRAAGEF